MYHCKQNLRAMSFDIGRGVCCSVTSYTDSLADSFVRFRLLQRTEVFSDEREMVGPTSNKFRAKVFLLSWRTHDVS